MTRPVERRVVYPISSGPCRGFSAEKIDVLECLRYVSSGVSRLQELFYSIYCFNING